MDLLNFTKNKKVFEGTGVKYDLITSIKNKLNPLNRTRERLIEFENKLSNVPGAVFGDSELNPLKHSFSQGIYVREIFIPKDTIIVGKIHKHEHPNFLMSGEVSVFTENNGVERLKAPLSMISPPGTKRIVYAHEDSVWITVHKTKHTDLEKIEKEIIAEDFSEYERYKFLTMLRKMFFLR